MPGRAELLDQLHRIANGAFIWAVLWHVAIAALITALCVGWRPGRRATAAIVAAPLASAALFAWRYDNPFNTTVLGAAAITILILSGHGGQRPFAARDASIEAKILAVGLAAFAWVYPHFLDDHSFTTYLVGAPVGVIPCPSLALALAGWLACMPHSTRTQGAVVCAVAAFYGAFGVLRLGVSIDLLLVAGAVGVMVQRGSALARRSHERVS